MSSYKFPISCLSRWWYIYICFVQSGNWRNLEIPLHILGIPKLHMQSQDCIINTCTVSRLRNACMQSQDPHATVRPTASDLLCSSQVYYWSFSGTVWVTCVTSVVAYSDFTSKSPDYVLSKTSLFSTKLSQTIIS